MLGTDTAVLVADISGSTALYESIGNAAAFNQIAACLDKLRQITESHGGRFVHSKGDDILCTFADPQPAFQAAAEMLTMAEDSALSVHCGMDFGPVLHARGDIFGDCVNTTARLAGYANPGEALCSQAFFQHLAEPQQAAMRFLEKWRFKGKAEGARVYSFAGLGMENATHYTSPAQTAVGVAQPHASGGGVMLELSYQGAVFTCSDTAGMTLGRSETCDLVVPRLWVSRMHATLEIRANKAYLRDTSTNGTYVCFPGQNPLLARREVVLLPDRCQLSLTKEPSDPEAELISCRVHLDAGT